MLSRCTKPSSDSYKRYGAAGITVCERWMIFENFLSDMGERPEGCTIDRIDGSKGYYPENCRWATAMEQQSNIKTNVVIEFRGERKHINEWARYVGCDPSTIRYRLRSGWSIEEALTKDARLGNRTKKTGQRLIEHNGRTQCLSAWAREFNLSISLLRLRLEKGMSVSDALTTPKGKPVKSAHQQHHQGK